MKETRIRKIIFSQEDIEDAIKARWGLRGEVKCIFTLAHKPPLGYEFDKLIVEETILPVDDIEIKKTK